MEPMRRVAALISRWRHRLLRNVASPLPDGGVPAVLRCRPRGDVYLINRFLLVRANVANRLPVLIASASCNQSASPTAPPLGRSQSVRNGMSQRRQGPA